MATALRTSNPVLSDRVFGGDWRTGVPAPARESAMSLEGTATKTGILLALVTAAAWFTWQRVLLPGEGGFAAVMPWAIGSAIAALVVAIAICFRANWSPFLAPLYALLEGVFLGAISAAFEVRFPGIVPQAVMLTFGTLGGLLIAYRTGIIKATENFKLGVFAATAGIGLVYLVGWILSFFGTGIPLIHGSGPIGIAFSVFVVVIAALNLVLDFDFIERGVQRGAPRYMEWYAAFGLLVTLVWLYLEILRLLSKLQSRR